MNSRNDITETADTLGLHFFGTMTASISHELKNALAIVNENAGLLGDLAHLMEKGRPLEPQRLHGLSDKIRKQVQRADTIIRRLNRFAHSAHEAAVSSETREIFEFTTALATRLAAMKGITLTVAEGTSVCLEVRPFVLENLLWLCLKQLLVLAEGSENVEFSAVEADDEVVVVLRFDDTVPVAEIGARVAREGEALLAELAATMEFDAQQLRLKISRKPAQHV